MVSSRGLSSDGRTPDLFEAISSPAERILLVFLVQEKEKGGQIPLIIV